MNSSSLIRLCLVVLLGTFFRTCSGEAFFLPDIGPADPFQDPAAQESTAAANSAANTASNSAANANTIDGNDGRFGSGFGANGNLALAGEVHTNTGGPRPLPTVDGPDNIITFPRPGDPRGPRPRPVFSDRMGPGGPGSQDSNRPMSQEDRMSMPPQRDSCYHGGYPHQYMNQEQHREMHRKAIEEVMWDFVPLMQKNETSESNMTSSTGPHHQSQSHVQDPLGPSSTNQSSTNPRTLESPADPLSPSSTGPDSPESPKIPENPESPKVSNSSSTSPITQDM